MINAAEEAISGNNRTGNDALDYKNTEDEEELDEDGYASPTMLEAPNPIINDDIGEDMLDEEIQ